MKDYVGKYFVPSMKNCEEKDYLCEILEYQKCTYTNQPYPCHYFITGFCVSTLIFRCRDPFVPSENKLWCNIGGFILEDIIK